MLDFHQVVRAVEGETAGREERRMQRGVVLVGIRRVARLEERLAPVLESDGREVILEQEVDPAVEVGQGEGSGGKFVGPRLAGGKVLLRHSGVERPRAVADPITPRVGPRSREPLGPGGKAAEGAGQLLGLACQSKGFRQEDLVFRAKGLEGGLEFRLVPYEICRG